MPMHIHTQDSFVERRFSVYFRKMGWEKRKTVNNSHQIRTDCGCFESSEKMSFSPVTPKSRGLTESGCAGNRHCWWCTPAIPVPALLVSSAVLGAPPPDSPHTSVLSHHGRLPGSCNGRWNRSIWWFGLTPAPRLSYFTQLLFYSTEWLCLGWAQLLFGYSLVIIQCHRGPLKI